MKQITRKKDLTTPTQCLLQSDFVADFSPEKVFDPNTIIASIDWVTVMYRGAKPRDVARLFGVFSDDFIELMESTPPVETTAGFFPQVTWTYNNVRVSFDHFSNWSLDACCTIRVDCSSHGLKFLQNFCGTDFLQQTFNIVPSLDGWHFTRLDVAYDFFGLGEFTRRTHDEIVRHQYYGSYLSAGSKKPRSYKAVCSNGITCYMGSTSSKELLRIYDKAAEVKSKHGSLANCVYAYVDDNGEFHAPEQWTRFEIQLRHKDRIREVYKKGDIYTLFNYILTNYTPTDREGKRFASWEGLKLLADRGTIIQNTNFVDSVCSLEKAEKFFPRTVNTLVLLSSEYGFDAIKDRLNAYLSNIQTNSDAISQVRWRKLYAALKEGNGAHLIKLDNGLYQIQ